MAVQAPGGGKPGGGILGGVVEQWARQRLAAVLCSLYLRRAEEVAEYSVAHLGSADPAGQGVNRPELTWQPATIQWQTARSSDA